MFSIRDLDVEVGEVDARYASVSPTAEQTHRTEAFALHRNEAQRALGALLSMNVKTISMVNQIHAMEFMRCRASLNRCHALIDLMNSGNSDVGEDQRFWRLRGERVFFRNAISFLSLIRSKVIGHERCHSPPPIYDSIVLALLASRVFETHKRWLKRLVKSK